MSVLAPGRAKGEIAATNSFCGNGVPGSHRSLLLWTASRPNFLIWKIKNPSNLGFGMHCRRLCSNLVCTYIIRSIRDCVGGDVRDNPNSTSGKTSTRPSSISFLGDLRRWYCETGEEVKPAGSMSDPQASGLSRVCGHGPESKTEGALWLSHTAPSLSQIPSRFASAGEPHHSQVLRCCKHAKRPHFIPQSLSNTLQRAQGRLDAPRRGRLLNRSKFEREKMTKETRSRRQMRSIGKICVEDSTTMGLD